MADLSGLNPQQREAASTIEGPVLILAGAGTGKTNALAHRVAHLIDTGADPHRILLLTFTRRAAAEMSSRAQAIVGAQAPGLSQGRIRWAGTFHAIANRLLRLHAESVGLDPSFTVLDRSDAADLIDIVRGNQGAGATKGGTETPHESNKPGRFFI